MIAWLKGILIEKNPPKLIIDVNGVGYEVEASMNTIFKLPEVNEQVTLLIYTQIREDSHCLFGFYNKNEKALFQELIKTNGVGPKLAISILSNVSPEKFCHDIQSQNIEALTKLPGIGKKTAERLYIELHHKLDAVETNLSMSQHTESIPSSSSAHSDAVTALKSLGYKNSEINRALKQVSDDASSEQILRQALQALAM